MLELKTFVHCMYYWQRVRQGCSLSPLLYLIYDEAMIREATDNMETGISVVGRIINTTMQTTRQCIRKGYSS